MRDDDVMAQLREANRVSEASLSRTDRGALDALREGITMTTRPPTPTRAVRRRFARRGLIAAGLSLTVVGGGAAYAAYTQLYVGTDDDHLTCMTEWAPSDEGYPDALSAQGVTGDPVADCQAVQAYHGAEPIADPVAFVLDDETFVAPRSQVPEGATVLEGSAPQSAAALELQASLYDAVDGLEAGCSTPAEAAAFAREELDRLGLLGWAVDASGPTGALECAAAHVDADSRTVDVVAGGGDASQEDWSADDPSAHVLELRETLREEVAGACVSLGDAERIALAAGGDSAGTHSVVTIPDPEAACTRVDLVVRGSWMVTLRGPEVATP